MGKILSLAFGKQVKSLHLLIASRNTCSKAIESLKDMLYKIFNQLHSVTKINYQ